MKTSPTSPRRHRFLQPTVFGGAAAASALFALQHSADAAVIYSGPQNVTAGPIGTFGTAITNVLLAPGALLSFRVARYPNGADIIGLATIAGITGITGFALDLGSNLNKLALGDPITAGQPFGLGSIAHLRGYKNGAPVYGIWPVSATGFAGFKLTNGDLGWVRLKWMNTDGNPDPNSLTLIDSAYNNVPGQSILAGQTVAAPEPSGTALLALAGAGAAALRRRRKAA